MFDNTFISLHRKIIKSAVFSDGDLLKVWIWCLVRANHIDREVVQLGQVIQLSRGQFITGRFAAAEELQMTTDKYRSRIATLVKLGQICQKATNKYSIITVVNYSSYQDKPEKIPNKSPTNPQQIPTDNNVNNDNNTNPQSGEKLKANQSVNMAGFNKYGDDYEFDPIQTDPEHKAKKAKKSGKASEDQLAVFELFNNPAKGLWRMREIEREAAQILFDTYGLETLKRRLGRIESEKQKKDPFLPQVDTPSELLDKMPKVERYLNI